MLDELKEDQIVRKVGGRFKLSTLIQKRMIAMNKGARPLVDHRAQSQMEVVIREIMEDKIYLDLSGQVQTRDGIEAESIPTDGGVVDLTQPEQ